MNPAGDPSAEAYKIEQISFKLPAPLARAVSSVLTFRWTYAKSGKPTRFEAPQTHLQNHFSWLVPVSDYLFDSNKISDSHDGWEAEVLWDTGYNLKVAHVSVHELAKPLVDKDLDAVSEGATV